jgi:hypothetical protein
MPRSPGDTLSSARTAARCRRPARIFSPASARDLSRRGKRLFCRPCLDWSERRYLVAGLVGTEIWRRCLELRWLTRERDSRALRLTAAGKAGLLDVFGVDFADEAQAPARKAAVSA